MERQSRGQCRWSGYTNRRHSFSLQAYQHIYSRSYFGHDTTHSSKLLHFATIYYVFNYWM